MSTKTRKPDGLLGYYLIHGKPNLTFFTPWKSEGYMDLKKAEGTGEIATMFPRSSNPRAAIGTTKRHLEEMKNQFDQHGVFKTRDVRVAARAYRASLNMEPNTRVDEHSLPLPEEPAPVVKEDDEFGEFQFESTIMPEEKAAKGKARQAS